MLGGPSGDLQLVTLVALIALARTYGAALRTEDRGLAEGERTKCNDSLENILYHPLLEMTFALRWRG